MNFSKLNQRIILQDYDEICDGTGDVIYVWKDAHEIWADVQLKKMPSPKKTKNVIYQGNVYEIIMRYNANISPRMRIKYNAQILLIETIHNLNHNNKYLIISAIQKVY